MSINNLKLKMLIVDDIESNRQILKNIFEESYVILEADNGQDAIAVLNANTDIAVVLLDLFMDNVSGFEVLEIMQNDPVLSGIPVIANTAYGEQENIIKALKLGAVDCVMKPYNPEIIRRRISNTINITILKRRILEEKLDRTRANMKTILQSIKGGIVVLEYGKKMKITYRNENLLCSSGYSREELGEICEDVSLILNREDIAKIDALIQQSETNKAIDTNLRLYTKEKSAIWVKVIANKIGQTEGGNPIYNIFFIDITAEKISESKTIDFLQKMRRAAECNALTGIYNRDKFYVKTSEMLRKNFNRQYVIACFDIDNFKIINELFGTLTADKILIAIANAFKTEVGRNGTFARLESDHFAICVPKELLNIEYYIKLGESCLENLRLDYNVTLHAGIYLIDNITVPVNLMCDRANLALETVKGNFLHSYAFYDDALREEMLQEEEIVNDMNAALLNGQFSVHFQPIYSISSQAPVSAEALVRWNHPTKGFIPPSIFIPIFERNGFIIKLDEYVWEETCKFIQNMCQTGTYVVPISVSVNVSRMNFYNPTFCDDIISMVEKYSITPSMLNLEITESAYMDNANQLLETMGRLQKYGFKILMDDFGSGFSSLNMLKDVPVDVLKIDMRFINEIGSSPRAGSVLTSIVRMAKWLDMIVVAEGVENKDQYDFLRSIGCDRIQGYYYSRPLPMKDFKTFLTGAKQVNDLYETNLDVSKVDIDLLWETNREINMLFNGMIGAIGLYEIFNDTIEVVRVNDGYYEIMGGTPDTLYQDTHDTNLLVYEEDKQILLDACARAVDGQVQSVIIRKHHRNNSMMWLEVKARFLGNKGKRKLYYFLMNDVTDRKKSEYNEKLTQYSAALFSVFDEVYEFDIEKNISHRLFSKFVPDSEVDITIKLGVETSKWIERHVVAEAKKEAYDFFNFEEMKDNNAGNSSEKVCQFEIEGKNGTRFFISCLLLKIAYNTYLYCVRDITDEVQEEQQLAQQVKQLNFQMQQLISSKSSAKKKVLVVDDSPINRKILSKMLGSRYEILETANGKAALELLDSNNDIAAVLLDLVMPEMDGYQFLEVVRKDKRFVTLPILVLTEMEGEDIERKILELGANDYLNKPYNSTVIFQRLANAIALCEQTANNSVIEHMMNRLPGGVAMIEVREGYLDVIFASKGFSNICFGAKQGIYNWDKVLQYVYDGDIEQTKQSIQDSFVKCAAMDLEFRIVRENTQRWIRTQANFAYKNADASIYYLVVSDLTELKNTQEQLIRTKELAADRLMTRYEKEKSLRKALTADSLSFFEFDLTSNKLLKAHTPTMNSLKLSYDYSIDRLIREYTDAIVYIGDKERFEQFTREQMLTQFESGEREILIEYRGKSKGTEQYRWILASIYMIEEHENGHIIASWYAKDIDAKKRHEMELVQSAQFDSLTGLFNRKTFENTVKEKLSDDSQDLSALFMVDIDNFKSINDTYGHAYGDMALKSIASKIKSVFRASDIVGRIGGDEFAIFLSRCNSEKDMKRRAEILCEALKIGFWDEGKSAEVSCSVGVAVAPKHGKRYDELYMHADEAQYIAKHSGKNQYKMFSTKLDDPEGNRDNLQLEFSK